MEVTIEIKRHQLETFYEAVNEYSEAIKVKKVLKSEYCNEKGHYWDNVTLVIDDDGIELLFGLGISFSTKVLIKRNY